MFSKNCIKGRLFTDNRGVITVLPQGMNGKPGCSEPLLALLPRARMREGVNQSVFSVCLSVCLSVCPSGEKF